MSVLLTYMTRHGCSEKAAKLLAENLHADVAIVNLKKDPNPDLTRYDTVIIGGSIHAGNVQKGVKKFYRKNRDYLLQKRLGLYLCCMEEGDTARDQFNEAFPEYLRKHATATGLFGGEFNFKKMNFIERKIVKKITNISESISKIDIEAIYRFAEKFS